MSLRPTHFSLAQSPQEDQTRAKVVLPPLPSPPPEVLHTPAEETAIAIQNMAQEMAQLQKEIRRISAYFYTPKQVINEKIAAIATQLPHATPDQQRFFSTRLQGLIDELRNLNNKEHELTQKLRNQLEDLSQQVVSLINPPAPIHRDIRGDDAD